MLSEATLKSLERQKRLSVQSTRQKLELALNRIVNGSSQIVKPGTKVSATAVAKEAGVDRATLYRFHEPILEQIRKINAESPKSLLRESRVKLATFDPKIKEYRALVEEAQYEVTLLARINYQLEAKISELEEALEIKHGIITALKQQINQKK